MGSAMTMGSAMGVSRSQSRQGFSKATASGVTGCFGSGIGISGVSGAYTGPHYRSEAVCRIYAIKGCNDRLTALVLYQATEKEWKQCHQLRILQDQANQLHEDIIEEAVAKMMKKEEGAMS